MGSVGKQWRSGRRTRERVTGFRRLHCPAMKARQQQSQLPYISARAARKDAPFRPLRVHLSSARRGKDEGIVAGLQPRNDTEVVPYLPRTARRRVVVGNDPTKRRQSSEKIPPPPRAVPLPLTRAAIPRSARGIVRSRSLFVGAISNRPRTPYMASLHGRERTDGEEEPPLEQLSDARQQSCSGAHCAPLRRGMAPIFSLRDAV